jgi:Glycosyltransferase
MKDYKITVIMSIYNDESTMERSIDSLVHQTLKGIEVIIIDDCSTDHSSAIAKRYAQNNENIRFIQNNTNKGLGANENQGVREAKGEFIGFLDGDDYVSHDFYEKLYNRLQRSNSDVVVGNFFLVWPDSNTVSQITSENLFLAIHPQEEPLKYNQQCLLPGLVVAGHWGGSSSCTKLIRKKLLVDSPFFEGRCCDDLSAVLPIVAQVEKVAYVPDAYYYYVQSNGSMERGAPLERRLDAFSSIGEALLRYQKANVDIHYSYLLAANSLLNVAGDLLNDSGNKNVPDLYNVIYDRLTEKVSANYLSHLLDERENPYIAASLNRFAPDKIAKCQKAIQLFCLQRADAGTKSISSAKLPLVSIIIPVYNGENYLKEAIESALSQTYRNKEIIVVNDGSKDTGATEFIARAYGNKIRYFRKENGGVASALNHGIEKAQGRYISWLSHDDLYEPDKVEQEVDLLLSLDNEKSVVFCAYKTIGPNGDVLQEYHLPDEVAKNVKCLLSLDITYTLNGCATLVSRDLLINNPFDSKLKYTQDYDLWFRLASQVPFVYLDKCLMLSRQHPQQDSRAAGPAVTIEADDYHCKAINSLTWSDVFPYLTNGNSLEKLWNAHRDAGFPGTSAAILALNARCLKFKENESKLHHFLKQEIGLCDESFDDVNHLLTTQECEKPTLLIYSNIWVFGGTERVMSVLIPHFMKRFRVVLVSCKYLDMEGFALPKGVAHIRIVNEHSTIQGIRIGAIAQIAKAKVFLGNPNLMLPFLNTYRVMHSLGIHSIALNHYYYFLPYHEEWLAPVRDLRFEAFKYADIVLWLTNLNAACSSAQCKNIGVMPNPNTFALCEVERQRVPKRVIAVGRFYDSMKRVDRILEVFAQFYKKDNEATLVLVGGYELDQVMPGGKSARQILAESNFKSGAVEFVGDQSDVRPYYEEAQALLLASDCEGFPMVLTEATVYGVPALIYGTPGLQDLIIDGENGYLVPDGEIERAADKLYMLLNDQAHWQRMSERAKELSKRFDVANIAAKWDKLFDLFLTKSEVSMADRLMQIGIGVPKKLDVDCFMTVSKEYQTVRSALCNYENRKEDLIVANNSNFQENTQIVYVQDNTAVVYAQEVANMKNTLSWRITRPLRLVKRAMIIKKEEGLRSLVKKAVAKLKSRS